MLGETYDTAFARKLKDMDRCIVGMLLQIAVYFGITDVYTADAGRKDADRIEAIVDNLLEEIMPDGGWNCRKGRKMSNRPAPHHSSFHTTFKRAGRAARVHGTAQRPAEPGRAGCRTSRPGADAGAPPALTPTIPVR